MFSSLISLEDSKYTTISQQVIDHLNLTEIFRSLLEINEGEEAIVYQMCQDKPTISFRQSIMKDFLSYPGLLKELEEQLKAFGKFRHEFEKELDKSSRLYYLIELLLVVEASVDCLEAVYQTLTYYDIHSEGLLKLKASVGSMMTEALYKSMKEDRKKIRYIFNQIKSVEVSINMNTGMRPYEAQITEVNNHKYRYPKAFRRVSDSLAAIDMFLGKQTKHYIPLFTIEKINLDFLEEIEFALKDHKDSIRHFLNKYSKIDAMPFMHLHEEITFYSAGMALYETMKGGGLWMAFPEMMSKDGQSMVLAGAYNIHLGAVFIKEGCQSQLVTNDFRMNSGDVVLMTGANRGGKTTFTQLIGQCQVLAQLGFPIPAKGGQLSLCDRIATHFPMIEQEAVDYGRFGRACFEFKEAFDQMTCQSLMLMNESFSGTSHLESIEIATEVVKALVHKGVSTIYNTHLHELYDEVKTLDHVRSVTVGEVGSEQVYKVSEGLPRGFSQALEIAKEYGVTYEQLIQLLGGDSLEA